MSTVVSTEVVLHDLGNKVQTLLGQADQIVIQDQLSYNGATEFLGLLVDRRKEIVQTFAPMKEKAWAAHKEVVAQEKRFLDPTQEAETTVKRKIGVWNQEQERVRLAAERKAREEADRIAQEEALNAAVEAEQSGSWEEDVQAILENPVAAPAPIVAPTYQKAQGLSQRDNWKAEVTNLLLLVKFVAANPQFLNLLLPNLPAINSTARAQKSAVKIPGIRVFNEPVINVRR